MVDKQVEIFIVEDDDGHATLVERNLHRAGVLNPITRFHDGQEILDYFFVDGKVNVDVRGNAYMLLLDIRMPKVDGFEVLEKIKSDELLKRIPVIMLTTTDDPRDIERCHDLGCSNYVIKPVDYDKFILAVKNLGVFLKIVQVPDVP
jgi:CheY-like chemotaxis protein